MKLLKIGSSVVFMSIFMLSFLLYSEMSNTIPVLQGISIEKTLFWAMRIQLINLLSFMAIYILGNSIIRYKEFEKSQLVFTTLITTIIVKSIFEFIALFNSELIDKSAIILIPLVLSGIAIAIFNSKFIIQKDRWKNIKFKFVEKIILSTSL
jgi:hypothetical protein